MADQKINELPTKTAPSTGDKMLMIGAAEEYQIDYDKLASAILNKLSTQSFSSLDTTSKTVLGAIDELNSKTLGNLAYYDANTDRNTISNRANAIKYVFDNYANKAMTYTNFIIRYRGGYYFNYIIMRNGVSTNSAILEYSANSNEINIWSIIHATGVANIIKTFSDDATVLGQTINASDILVDIISDISEMDDINETCIRYVQGALLEGKSIYGFVLTAKAGTVLSQIIFGSFMGVSGMAVRGKSGSSVQWKDWKIL